MLARPRSRGLRLPALLAAGLALSSCADRTPNDVIAPQPDVLSSTGTVEVHVLRGGAPVPGFLVTVVNHQTGPFRSDGSVAMALTDANGIAYINNLPFGSYCAHVRPLISVNDATGNGTFIGPVVGYEPGASHADPAVVFTGAGTSVLLDNASYVEQCVANPILSLSSEHPIREVFVPLIPANQGATIQTQYLDPNGAPLQVGGWVIVDKSGEIPWFPAALALQGVKPGLLLSTGESQPDGTVTIPGLTPGVPVFLESGIANSPTFGLLTSTVQVETPSSSQSTNLGAIVLEPLLCTLNRDPEDTGDNTPGKIDFLGPIKTGFRADFGPPLTRRNEISIFYTQVGTGEAKLQLRLQTDKQINVSATYTWDGTSGTLTKVLPRDTDVTVGFAPLATGGVRVTWTIAGLPANLISVEYFVSTSGDQAPNPQRSDATSAYTPIPIPSICTGGQSNDDQWWLPM